MSWDGAERRAHDGEILSELKEISKSMATFQTTIGVHAFQLEQLFGNGQPGLLAEHGKRLASLEKTKEQTVGAKAVWGAISGFIGAAILYIGEWALRHK